MKIFRITFIVLFFLLLALPSIQKYFGILPRVRVEGMSLPKLPKDVSISSALSGELQKRFEQWFHRRNGLWEYFVRLDNQLNYKLFQQITSSYSSELLVGKDQVLFQRFYLNEWNNNTKIPDELLQHRVTLLKQTQDALARRGIPMLVVISANHLAVNPGIVSGKFASPNREQRLGNYQRMKPMLEAAGVNVLDGLNFFRQEFAEGKLHFTPSGSHWDSVGACLMANNILQRAEELVGKPLAELTCYPVVARETPRREELDLVQVANLWDANLYQRQTNYPSASAVFPENAYKPNVLIVGTSFMFSLLQYLERRNTVRNTDLFFYYKKHRRFPGGKLKAFERQKIDWEKTLEGRDLVLIESSSALMHEAGFEFLMDVLSYLAHHPYKPAVQ